MAKFKHLTIEQQLAVVQRHQHLSGSHSDTIWRVLIDLNPDVIAGDITTAKAKDLAVAAAERDSRREGVEKINFDVSNKDTNIEGNY